MNKILSSKLLLKFFSAAIAVVLWFAITYTEDPVISQVLNGIELTMDGEQALSSNGLAVVNKSEFPSVNIVIRGSRSNVISSMGEISAKIDVSAVTQQGDTVVPVTYSYPSSKVTLEKTKIKEITVRTEKLVSREIPIKIEVENRDKNEDHIVKAESRTKSVSVRGAESIMYKVSYAKAVIDVANITKTSSQECVYKFYDEKNNEIPREQVTGGVRDTLTVESTVYKRTELPVKIVLDKEHREDFGIVVKNAELDTVGVGMEDGVSAEFIEAEINSVAEKGGYEAKLIVPDGIYIPEEDRSFSVNGEILPKELKEITVKVEAKNVPEGKTAVISPAEKTVTLKMIGDATGTNINATVDLGKMTDAESVMPVNITADDDITVVGTYSVSVKLEDSNKGEE